MPRPTGLSEKALIAAVALLCLGAGISLLSHRTPRRDAPAGPPTQGHSVGTEIRAPATQLTESATNVSPQDPGDASPLDAIRRDRTQFISKLRIWAANDPEAALAAAKQANEGQDRNEALAAVCFGVAENDPAAAVNLAQSLHMEKAPGAIVENLVQQWASRDMKAALDWVNSQPAGEHRDGSLARVAFILSQSHPSEAAQIVAADMAPGGMQEEALITVVHQWGVQDPATAAAWVARFPEGSLRDRATAELRGMGAVQ